MHHFVNMSKYVFFSVGQVVNIKAKVNRAFSSSMEVNKIHIQMTPVLQI